MVNGPALHGWGSHHDHATLEDSQTLLAKIITFLLYPLVHAWPRPSPHPGSCPDPGMPGLRPFPVPQKFLGNTVTLWLFWAHDITLANKCIHWKLIKLYGSRSLAHSGEHRGHFALYRECTEDRFSGIRYLGNSHYLIVFIYIIGGSYRIRTYDHRIKSFPMKS